ncbi:rho guanine nucleotide exchange factor 17-like [Glandiceps talaboti]
MTEQTPGRKGQPPRLAQQDESVHRLGMPQSSRSLAKCNITRGQITSTSPVSSPERAHDSPVDTYTVRRFESPQYREEITAYPRVAASSTTYTIAGNAKADSQQQTYGRSMSPGAPGRRTTKEEIAINVLDDDVFESEPTLSAAASLRHRLCFDIDRGETNTNPSAYLAISQHGDLSKRHAGDHHQGPLLPRLHHSTGDLYNVEPSEDFRKSHGIYAPESGYHQHEREFVREAPSGLGQSPRLVATSQYMQTLPLNTQGDQSKFSSSSSRTNLQQYFPVTSDQESQTVVTMSESRPDRAVSPTHRRPSYLVERELGRQHIQETFHGSVRPSEHTNKQIKQQDENTANTYGTNLSDPLQMPFAGYTSDKPDANRTYSAYQNPNANVYSSMHNREPKYMNFSDMGKVELSREDSRTEFQEQDVCMGGLRSIHPHVDNIAAQRPFIEANVRQYLEKSNPLQYSTQKQCVETGTHIQNQAERQERMYGSSEAFPAGRTVSEKSKSYKDPPNRPNYLGLSDGQLSASRPQLKKVKICKQSLTSFSDLTPGSSRRASFSSVVSSDVGRDLEHDLEDVLRSMENVSQSNQFWSPRHSPRHGIDAEKLSHVEERELTGRDQEKVTSWIERHSDSSSSSKGQPEQQPIGTVSPTFPLKTNLDKFKFKRPASPLSLPNSPKRSPADLVSAKSATVPQVDKLREITKNLRAYSLPGYTSTLAGSQTHAGSSQSAPAGIQQPPIDEDEGIGPEQTTPVGMSPLEIPRQLEIPSYKGRDKSDNDQSPKSILPRMTYRTYNRKLNPELEAVETRTSSEAESSFKVTDPGSARTRRKNGADDGTSGNGGSNGRSRSDPTQDRKRVSSEDTDTGSLDSNLLISLNVNGGKINRDTASERPSSYGSDLSIASIESDDNSYLKVYADVTSKPAGVDKISELPDIRNGKGNKKKQPKSWTWPNGDSSQSDFIPVSGTRSVIHSSSEPVIPEVEQEDEEAMDVEPPKDKRSDEKYAIQSENQLIPLSIDEKDQLHTKELQIIIPLPQTKTATEKRKERLRKVKSEDRESIDSKTKVIEKANLKAETAHKKAASEPGTSVDQLKGKVMSSKKTVRELPQLPTGLNVPPKARVSKTISTPNLKAVSDESAISLELLPCKSPTSSTPGARSTLPRMTTPKIEPPPVKTKKEHSDDEIKKQVINNLLESEKSYVSALETLVKVYMKPLKSSENAGVIEPGMVDVIFYKIPEILESHTRFLHQLTNRVTNWNDKQKVGDLIIASFNKQRLMDDYLAFVDNFGQAKETFKEAKETKPSFRQFLECCRESKGKFTFDDLIIQPVQRIPRYSLIIKELLKHTSSNHPDHSSLKDARKEIEKLGQTINEADRAEKNLQTLRSIDSMVEGNVELIVPGREFLKQYPVSEMVQKGGREGLLKKDRALFLFSDLLMCTSVKRKSGRASISVFHPNLILEASKFKLLWKHHLDDVEVVKHSNVNRRASIERLVSQLEEDINVLNQIKDMSENLNYPHESLDEVIRELMESINKKLSENRLPAVMSPTLAAKEVEVQATTPGGMDTHVVVFNTMDMRISWEDELLKAKQKLTDSKDTFPPQFLNPIPISKTRSGMQFSCASPSHPTGIEEQREVWVCNSDGYVGQVCLLTLAPKPDVATCKTVCSARILCIAPVPGTPRRLITHRDHAASDGTPLSSPISIQVTVDETSSLASPHHTRRKNKQAAEIIAFDSDDSDENMSSLDRTLLHVDENLADDVSSDDDDGGSPSHCQSSDSNSEDEEDPDSLKPTMWLGTEDGCIHIYVCNDNVRTAKASKKIQHSASIQSILYHDNRVFTSLANGELVMYSRQPGGPWDFDSPQTLTIGNSNAPITKMAAVAGKLWCGRQNYIIVVDPNSFIVEQHIQISSEQNHNVQCIVTSGLGVWVSLSQQSNAVVKLYHAINYNHLCDTDVTQAVHKMLAGSDAIIRQHKAACLRITALLTCKDLLWVGTSAGVVLTLPLPKITSNNMSSLPETPPVTGSGHGHTGHVRFLTAVEMLQDDDSESSPTLREAIVRRCSVSATMMPNMLVISGGDGYEDFCSSSSNEAAGRDDSTNHLLLWKV